MKTQFFAALIFLSAPVTALASQNGEWTTISGKVNKTAANSFVLSSQNRQFVVEMDDNNWDADGYKLVKGDKVVVSGRIDNDLFEKKTIEAGAVYVKNLDAVFYASPVDEEGAPPFDSHLLLTGASLPEGATARAQGRVVKTEDDEFILHTGFRKLEVDTEQLSFDPLDEKGFVKVEKGDTVRVEGRIDDGFLEGKEITANFLLDFN